MFSYVSRLVHHFWKELLLIGILITVLMGYMATQMTIKTDLLVLLPQNDPYSKKYKEIFNSESIGETLMIVIEIKAQEKEAKQAAAQIKFELEKMVGIVNFFRKMDTVSMMGPAGILLTNADAFQKLSSTLNFLNFLVENPAAIDFTIVRQSGLSLLKIETLLNEMVGIESLEKYLFLSTDKQIMSMTVVLNRPAIDLVFTRSALSQIRDKVEAIVKPYGFSFGFSGSYQAAVDSERVITNDFSITTVITLILITFLFLATYGNIYITVSIFLCLVSGSAISLGAFYLLFQSLEFTSSFVLALLLGLGIDFGIHLSNRTMEYLLLNHPGFGSYSKVQKREATRDGVQYAIKNNGSSLFTGAITTIAAFLSMVFVDSPGLQHIGLMTGIGITLFFIVMVLFLPGWLILFAPRLKIKIAKKKNIDRSFRFFQNYSRKFSKWVAFVILLFSVPCIFFTVINFMNFNYTPSTALPNTIESVRTFGLLQKHGLGFSVDDAVIAFIEDPKKLTTVEKTLLEESKFVGSVLSLASFLPTYIIDDFDSFKQETVLVLDEAQNAFSLIALKRLDVYDDMKEIIDLLSRSRDFSQFANLLFQSNLLPSEARDFFTMEFDGKLSFKIYAFSKQNLWQNNFLKDYVEHLQGLGFEFFGYPVIYYQIAKKVISSIVYSVLVALVLIGITVVLTLKDFSLSMIVLFTLVLTVSILFGMSYLFGLTINFMTLLALPLLIGMSVEAPIHLLCRFKEEEKEGGVWTSEEFFQSVFLGTGKAITLSALTTAIAFFSFLAAISPLLMEFGLLLGIGIIINWLLTFIWVTGIRIYRKQKTGR